MALVETIDHVETGISRLVSQWSDKPIMKGLITSFMQSVQSLEDDLFQMLTERGIYTAIGEQLDVIGLMLEVQRLGREDSEYRAALLNQIAANNSDGSTETVIGIMETLTQTEDAQLWEHFPASFFLLVKGGYYPGLAETLDDISSAGVKATLLFDEGDSFVPGELGIEVEELVDESLDDLIVASGDAGFTELWEDPATLTGTGWIDNLDGSYTHSGTVSGEARGATGDLVEDTVYVVTVTATGAGSFDIQLGGAPTNGFNSATGLVAGVQSHVLTAETVAGNNYVRFITNDNDVTINNIEVREAVLDNLVIVISLQGSAGGNNFLPELIETETINPLCDLIENPD